MNKLQKQRARLIREAEALRTGEGFADDAAREAFDAKMAEVEAIDVKLRGQSETIVENDPLATRQPPADDDEDELDATEQAAAAERARCQGITLACRPRA